MKRERWQLGDNSDGRQWWTIVTTSGEIVAQAVRREDAARIVDAHNLALDLVDWDEHEAFREAEAAYWADPERTGLTLVAFRRGWIAGRDWQREQAENADVERLREALAWYADQENYAISELYSDDPKLRARGVTYRVQPIFEDNGERARAVLAGQAGHRGTGAALWSAVAGYVCGYCHNRVGYTPENGMWSPYRPPCTRGGCAPLRAALAGQDDEP